MQLHSRTNLFVAARNHHPYVYGETHTQINVTAKLTLLRYHQALHLFQPYRLFRASCQDANSFDDAGDRRCHPQYGQVSREIWARWRVGYRYPKQTWGWPETIHP